MPATNLNIINRMNIILKKINRFLSGIYKSRFFPIIISALVSICIMSYQQCTKRDTKVVIKTEENNDWIPKSRTGRLYVLNFIKADDRLFEDSIYAFALQVPTALFKSNNYYVRNLFYKIIAPTSVYQIDSCFNEFARNEPRVISSDFDSINQTVSKDVSIYYKPIKIQDMLLALNPNFKDNALVDAYNYKIILTQNGYNDREFLISNYVFLYNPNVPSHLRVDNCILESDKFNKLIGTTPYKVYYYDFSDSLEIVNINNYKVCKPIVVDETLRMFTVKENYDFYKKMLIMCVFIFFIIRFIFIDLPVAISEYQEKKSFSVKTKDDYIMLFFLVLEIVSIPLFVYFYFFYFIY